MEYLVFPFGKYKGVKLRELPSTYVVLALESFDLPQELSNELFRVLMGRFGLFSIIADSCSKRSKKEFIELNKLNASQYE
jgi:hypothetical protein